MILPVSTAINVNLQIYVKLTEIRPQRSGMWSILPSLPAFSKKCAYAVTSHHPPVYMQAANPQQHAVEEQVCVHSLFRSLVP